jgi:serine protease AprX
MVLRKQFLIFISIYFFVSGMALAQTDPYIIYLSNKQGTSGTIANPSTYLSTKSIERRAYMHIQIDSSDLPVSQSYIDLIKNEGASVIYASKWMNAVYIQATAAQYASIINFPFVQGSIFSFKTTSNINTKTTNTTTNYAANYSDYLGFNLMNANGIKGKGALIAITDSGFPGVDTLTAFKHLWNNNQLIHYFDVADNEINVFNDDNHGTYMLSVLAADTNIYKGVAPEADYILLRTEVAGSETQMEEYHWLRAAEIADSCGADIISVSLGYTTYDNASVSYTYADMDGETSIIARAADMAYEKGMLVVSSAGNDGANSWKYIGTPADSKNVIAVGSVDISSNKRSGFSSVGPSADGRIKPDVCAVGSSVYCIKPDGSLLLTGGTSMATPMIVGMLAGIKQSYPLLSADEMKTLLLQSCDNYSNPNNFKGYGVPHFSRTFAYYSVYDTDAAVLIAPNPYLSGQLLLKVPQDSYSYSIDIFDNQGRIVEQLNITSASYMINLETYVGRLNPGFYLITVGTDTTRETLKWIKL